MLWLIKKSILFYVKRKIKHIKNNKQYYCTVYFFKICHYLFIFNMVFKKNNVVIRSRRKLNIQYYPIS